MMDSIGVRPKSTYVQSGEIRGIPAGNGGTPNEGYSKHKNPNVKIYAERWEQGLDIWTGEPLTGAGLMDWQKQRKKRRNLLE